MKLQLNRLNEINKETVSLTNEPYAVINKDNLESALGVQTYPYDSDEQIASSLLRSLVIAHGYQNGNKRTAVKAANEYKAFTCSDEIVRDLVYELADEGGSKLSIDYICKTLYDKLFEDIGNPDTTYDVKEYWNRHKWLMKELAK